MLACPSTQLNDADAHAVRQQPTRPFVPEVVPPQIDAFELLTAPFHAGLLSVSVHRAPTFARFPRRFWMFG
jgi:hypothetical protein